MEQKLLIGMIGGFIAFTLMAIVVVYALTADLSFNTQKSLSAEQKANITLDPKPQPEIKEPTKQSQPNPLVAGVSTDTLETTSKLTVDISNLYSLINAHRKEQNLSSLRVHPALELSSRRKLEDMRANNYWRHENSQGVMDWSIFDSSGYHYSSAGENLSFANNSAWSVFNSWVNSPLHNTELLKPEYEDMGLSVDCDTYREGNQNKCAVVLHLGRQM